jgi:hypothetical protein
VIRSSCSARKRFSPLPPGVGVGSFVPSLFDEHARDQATKRNEPRPRAATARKREASIDLDRAGS